MDITNLIIPESRQDIRQWLIKHYNKESVCFVQIQKNHPCYSNVDLYIDMVEEALCFGWIDSTVKRIDANTVAHRLSPRRPKSVWTELNKARFEKMQSLGLVVARGLDEYKKSGAFVIDEDIIKIINADPVLQENFRHLPPLYVRVRIDNIQKYKTLDVELYKKSLDKFIKNTRMGIIYGKWNDNGRL